MDFWNSVYLTGRPSVQFIRLSGGVRTIRAVIGRGKSRFAYDTASEAQVRTSIKSPDLLKGYDACAPLAKASTNLK